MTVSLRVLCVRVCGYKSNTFLRCSSHWNRTNSITFIFVYGWFKISNLIHRVFCVCALVLRVYFRQNMCVRVFLWFACLTPTCTMHISNVRWAKGSLNDWMHWEYTMAAAVQRDDMRKERSIIKKWFSDSKPICGIGYMVCTNEKKENENQNYSRRLSERRNCIAFALFPSHLFDRSFVVFRVSRTCFIHNGPRRTTITFGIVRMMPTERWTVEFISNIYRQCIVSYRQQSSKLWIKWKKGNLHFIVFEEAVTLVLYFYIESVSKRLWSRQAERKDLW